MYFDLYKFTEKINILFEGKSQTELANALKISQTMVSALKKGKIQSPGADIICRIATLYHVTPDWLLGVTTSEKNPNIEKIEHLIGIDDANVELLSELKAQKKHYTLLWLLSNYQDEKNKGNEKNSLWLLLNDLILYHEKKFKLEIQDKIGISPIGNICIMRENGPEVIAKDVFMPDYVATIKKQELITKIEVILNEFLSQDMLDVIDTVKKATANRKEKNVENT